MWPFVWRTWIPHVKLERSRGKGAWWNLLFHISLQAPMCITVISMKSLNLFLALLVMLLHSPLKLVGVHGNMSRWTLFYLLCVILFSWIEQCIKISPSLEIESAYISNFPKICIFVASHYILMILKFPSIIYIVLRLWELVDSTPQSLQKPEDSHEFERRLA